MIFGLAADQAVGQHSGTFVKRRDETVADAAMLGALAKRVDRGVGRHHAIIDDDTAIDGKTRFLGKA